MGPQPLDLSAVGVRFGPVVVLSAVTLQVTAGEALGVAGPNGAGKTTLLRLAATLTPPSAGEGSVLGARLGTPEVRRVRRLIGMSGHRPALYPELTLAENLRLVASLAGLDPGAADRALRQVGLAGAADRRADRASNGMQRRLDLARLLITRPQLLLLDEAHAGLDSAAEEIIDHLLATTLQRGGAALLVSHDAAALAQRVGRVVTLREGSLQPSPAGSPS